MKAGGSRRRAPADRRPLWIGREFERPSFRFADVEVIWAMHRSSVVQRGPASVTQHKTPTQVDSTPART